MKRPKRYALGMLLGIVVCAGRLNAQAAQYVDPFLGADAGGNVFVGPTLPFGMVKPGPDMDAGTNDENSGWAARGDIRGFSQTHVSGTGGGAKYGNILIQPTIGAPWQNDYASPRGNEHSEVGYYRVTLHAISNRCRGDSVPANSPLSPHICEYGASEHPIRCGSLSSILRRSRRSTIRRRHAGGHSIAHRGIWIQQREREGGISSRSRTPYSSMP